MIGDQGYIPCGMLLVVDVGNSSSTFAVFAEPRLLKEFRLKTRRDWTRQEWAVAIEAGLAQLDLSVQKVTQIAMCSVVAEVGDLIVSGLQESFGLVTVVIDVALVAKQVRIHYTPMHDVGIDRLVAGVAALHRYQDRIAEQSLGGVLVVDLGTATTFDVLSNSPEYFGGAIAPGVGIGASALVACAPRLPRVAMTAPASVLGQDTVSSLQSGIVLGYAALVEGMLVRLRKEAQKRIAGELLVVLTGGFAAMISEQLEKTQRHVLDDRLLLEGIALLHRRTRTIPVI